MPEQSPVVEVGAGVRRWGERTAHVLKEPWLVRKMTAAVALNLGCT